MCQGPQNKGYEMNVTFNKIFVNAFTDTSTFSLRLDEICFKGCVHILGGAERGMHFCSCNLTNCASRFLFISFSSHRKGRIFPIPLLFARGLVWHIANLVIMQFISRLSFTAVHEYYAGFSWAKLQEHCKELMSNHYYCGNISQVTSGYSCCNNLLV